MPYILGLPNDGIGTDGVCTGTAGKETDYDASNCCAGTETAQTFRVNPDPMIIPGSPVADPPESEGQDIPLVDGSDSQ